MSNTLPDGGMVDSLSCFGSASSQKRGRSTRSLAANEVSV